MSTGPTGGAPVPSMRVAPRRTRRCHGPSPSARGGAGGMPRTSSWDQATGTAGDEARRSAAASSARSKVVGIRMQLSSIRSWVGRGQVSSKAGAGVTLCPMRIDAHQHFWHYHPAYHLCMTEAMAALRRDYLPDELAPLLRAAGFDGTIAVQARQLLQETEWLLALAERHPWVQGVV